MPSPGALNPDEVSAIARVAIEWVVQGSSVGHENLHRLCTFQVAPHEVTQVWFRC